ncbi:MAG: FAD:protein FMN transferase [Clostridia bacterium]|nr:FAD:protein FMN transferase [Clostridia bacterium]
MQRDINKTKELIDFNNLLINDEDNTVYLKKKGCSIDVGAVAKGFVCEDIKEFLNSVGFKKGIINIGGNVLIVGEKGEKESFKVGIKNPFGSGNLYNVLVNDKSVVTSGDYERFYEIDGKRYNHIINTNTLSPSSLNKSVTIICNNSALADALSTALFIMDYTEGIKLIDSIENCEALIIDEKGAEYFSSNFEKYLQK